MTAFRSRAWIALLLAPTLALTACGEFRERSLCSQYEDFQGAVAQVQTLDPATATAEDVQQVANDVLAELDQLLAASDGAYDYAISTLRASLVAFRESVSELETDDLAVARPLLRESWEDVVVAYQVMEQRLDVVCPTT